MKIPLMILCIVAAMTMPLWSQESSQEEGFGLQASIFQNIRMQNSDIIRNFMDASTYNLTPGDIFTLSLSSGVRFDAGGGNSTSSYSIQLQEDYTLDIPVMGSIDTKGKRIPELQKIISDGLKKALALQYVSFNLSAPAQFNVFIYGNVLTPGYIIATPMHRLIDAIGVANGFKSKGSYRQIQLQRAEQALTLDISRFYSHADLDSNPFLRPGDRIFVPYAEIVASIGGLVRFPGNYELIQGETILTLIRLAGGTTPGALTSRIEVSRIEADGAIRRYVVDSEEEGDFRLNTGDVVVVRSVSDNSERITIEGAIYGTRTSGTTPVQVPKNTIRLDYPYFPGISLLAVLDSSGGPTPYAVLEKSLLRRASTGQIHNIDIESLWETRDPQEDIDLFPGDYILVPMQKLEVFVSGMVQRPGAVSFTAGYSVGDYLLKAGGVIENSARRDAMFLLDERGRRITKLEPTDLIEAGSHIHVDKKWLFAADQAVQNALITTVWVTNIILVVTTVWDFVSSYIVPAITAGQQ